MRRLVNRLLLDGKPLVITALVIVLCVAVSLIARWVLTMFVASADQQRWIAAVIAYLGALLVFIPRIVSWLLDYRMSELGAISNTQPGFQRIKERAKGAADNSKLAVQFANPIGFALVTLSFLLGI